MNLRRTTLVVLGGFLCVAATDTTPVAEQSNRKHPRSRRIFTNEDLQRYSEKYGEGARPASAEDTAPAAQDSKTATVNETPSAEKEKQSVKSEWAAKLKKAEEELAKFKAAETKFSTALDKYRNNLAEAKSDFHKQTAQLQIADSEKNLAWAKEEVRKAEEAKAKLLAEATKNGMKAEDLMQPPQPSSDSR